MATNISVASAPTGINSSTPIQAPPAPVQQPAVVPVSQPANVPQVAPQVVTQPPTPQITGTTTANGQPISTPTATPALSEAQRTQLDGIVQKMVSDGQSQQNIQAVVADFKQKYATPIATSAPTDQKKTVGGYALNTVKATGSLLKNAVTGIANIFNPNVEQNTVVNAAKILTGALTSTLTLGQVSNHTFDEFAQLMDQKYGSWDNFKNTLYTDTPGVLLDVSSLLDPTGEALSAAGKAGDVAELSKAGEITSKVADTINPISQTTKAVGAVAGTAGNVVAKTLGLTTGAGADAIKETFNNPSEANAAAMRGTTPPEQIVADAKAALDSVKTARNTQYQAALAKLPNTAQDIAPVQSTLADQLQKFGVKMIKDDNGKPVLDFSHSTISDPAEQAKISRITSDVSSWDDPTTKGLDTLKRRVGSEFSPNSDVRAFVSGMKQSITGVLNKVPGYSDMTTAYAKASNFIDDIQKNLSLSDKTMVETGLKKLTSALKQNNEFRQELVQQLQEAGGKDLTGSIAGNALNPLFSRGLTGRLIEGGSVLKGVAAMLHPQMLATIAATSPRLIGELTRVAGKVAKTVGDVTEKIPAPVKKQLGRVAKGSAIVQKASSGSRSSPKAGQ